MVAKSLYNACKEIYREGVASTKLVGGYETNFEWYTQADIDANVADIAAGEATGCTFGDSDQSKVLLVMDSTINIPAGYTLKPVSPKKSLVICCNTFVNNGNISMSGKGPNILSHSWFLLGHLDYYGADNDIIVPAYANNRVEPSFSEKVATVQGANGTNGTNRNCGAGGAGGRHARVGNLSGYSGASGSGYAFGGGAGSGGVLYKNNSGNGISVDTTYPMRGSNFVNYEGYDSAVSGGVGNPSGGYSWTNVTNHGSYANPSDSGVGGRIIIYCNTFENNGGIKVNGVSNSWTFDKYNCWIINGGASGAGAVDVFYTELVSEGTIEAYGGSQANQSSSQSPLIKGGNGGNGSITLLNWDIEKVVRAQQKYMSKSNMAYFLQELVNKINGD